MEGSIDMTNEEYCKLSQTKQHVIQNEVHRLVSWFEMIPTQLWRYAIEHDEHVDETTFKVHSFQKVCSWCGNEDINITTKVDDDMHDWECCNCDANCHRTGYWYEELPVRSIVNLEDLYSMSFWTNNWKSYCKDFIRAAESAGFYVYEPLEFDGLVLFYEGSFYPEIVWLDLYLELGLTWHEGNPDWEK
jgi:hypothetical protein